MAASQQRSHAADLRKLAAVDPRLACVCETWESMPEHIILANIALVESVRGEESSSQHPRSDIHADLDRRWSRGSQTRR